MRVLIGADETAAYENLVDILGEVSYDIQIAGNTESVTQTIHWLQSNPAPDLIFMDIHLSDGSAFTIFDKMELETPIIFTTAYDRYAIEAFKVNSIDKYKKLTRQDVIHYLSKLTQLVPTPKYKDKLLIPYKDKLLPIDLKEVSCFYTADKNTCIYLKDGNVYPYSKTLEQIMASLNPADFIRANKQFILARNSVTDITIWFDNRLLVTLDVETPERIYISKNKASEFKSWIVNNT